LILTQFPELESKISWNVPWEKHLKIALRAGVLAVSSAVAIPCATAAQSKQSQEGIIVNVHKEDVATTPIRRAPLQSHYYRYEVSVQLNWDVYIGRYESELDDLPFTLSPNNRVPMRVRKHVMYLDSPGDVVQMQIVHHKVSHVGACRQAVFGMQ
jgi:hypothetical protein